MAPQAAEPAAEKDAGLVVAGAVEGEPGVGVVNVFGSCVGGVR